MIRRLLGIAALSFAVTAPLSAQAFYYPSFQTSRVAEREYNFGLADIDGDATAIVFQWREGLGNPKLQFTLDAGFADFDAAGADALLMIGGALNYQLARATTDMPFDVVLTGGLGFSTSDQQSLLRVPIGAVVGHRFPLEGTLAITPYVHPRLSIDRYTIETGFGDVSDTDTNVDIDLGANFEFNQRMALRLSFLLGDADALGLSFAWSPRGLRATR